MHEVLFIRVALYLLLGLSFVSCGVGASSDSPAVSGPEHFRFCVLTAAVCLAGLAAARPRAPKGPETDD